jgi:hypothetical protein
MKSCPTCHKSYPNNLKFCSSDGSPLGIDILECEVCKKLFADGARYCPYDGTLLAYKTEAAKPFRFAHREQRDGHLTEREAARPRSPSARRLLLVAVIVLSFLVGSVLGSGAAPSDGRGLAAIAAPAPLAEPPIEFASRK